VVVLSRARRQTTERVRVRHRNTRQVSLEAQLSAAPPDAAVGVITYSASRTTISFATVGHDGGKTIVVYSDPSHYAFRRAA
jgi:hypothetical protein